MRTVTWQYRSWSLRRGAALALALVGVLFPAAAASRAGAATGDPGARRDAAPEERVPVSSPAILVGEVLVKSDNLGRLAVLVAELEPGVAPAAASRLFLLTPAAPLTSPIEERFPIASVVFRGDSLTLASPSHRFTLDLALASRSDGRHEVLPGSVVLHDGIALQSVRLGGAPRALDSVTLDDRESVIEDPARISAQQRACQAGGEGSSTCSKKCTLTIGGFSVTDECSVLCTEGYYSCCKCDVHDQGATCECMKNAVGPRPPASVMVDPF